ncbi:MAG: hypothetical protein JXA78_14360 [Anaerolineales bacterium]|nr:hypothetical protein [Anaerolineales bacterium]
MFGLLKVTGESLSPDYREGDFVLLLKIPFFLRRLRQGDTVVFRQPYYGVMIKRVEWQSQGGGLVYVLGAHPDSADSRKFGPVPREDLLGKVVWHIKKPGRGV